MNHKIGDFYDLLYLFQMDLEVPCRDTDPVENTNMEAKVEPLAFTIDFGDSENLEEKAKKFERFAQRSSQRKVKSPRQDKDIEAERGNIEKTKQIEDKQRVGMERLDINNEREDTQEVNDEVSSQTGTYTMEEEEEMNQVIEIIIMYE